MLFYMVELAATTNSAGEPCGYLPIGPLFVDYDTASDYAYDTMAHNRDARVTEVHLQARGDLF